MSDPADARPGSTVRPVPPAQKRGLAAPDEAERPVVRVLIDPDLDGVEQGNVARGESEGEGCHARRAAALNRLFGTNR